jgi:hypothetical protein
MGSLFILRMMDESEALVDLYRQDKKLNCRQTCPRNTLPTTDPTRTPVGLNLVLWDEKTAKTLLSYSMTYNLDIRLNWIRFILTGQETELSADLSQKYLPTRDPTRTPMGLNLALWGEKTATTPLSYSTTHNLDIRLNWIRFIKIYLPVQNLINWIPNTKLSFSETYFFFDGYEYRT